MNPSTLAPDASVRSQFEDDGFYLARGVYSPEEVDALEGDFDRIVAQLMNSGENVNARWHGAAMERLGATESVVIHTHNVQCFSARWHAAMQHPRFLDFATQILGADVILHHSKLFQKPAEKGAPFPMHQDWQYFPTIKDTMMAGVVHVSDATDEMGCFRVYPGSHKLGRQSGMQGNESDENQKLRDRYPLEGATIVEAKRGDVLFFHYCLLHGSMPNRSNATRKTVLVQMHAGHDAVEEGNRHPNARLVLAGWNHAASRKKAEAVD